MIFRKVILLVEDEEEPAEMLSNYLEIHEFNVILAKDGREALKLIKERANEINLAILDIMVPYMDGKELLKFIRSHPVTKEIPVIFLTAKDREKDEIQGLALGADDYISKPASLNLVLAHVNSLLRRQVSKQSKWITFGNIFMDMESREVYLNKTKLELTATEFHLLALFFENPKRVYTRQEILEHITDEDKYVFDRTVDVHVKNLRLKLKDDGDIIKTYRGMGYGLNKEMAHIV